MPKNILVDLNVIMDVLQERQNYQASRAVLQYGEAGKCHLYISAHMVTTFAYLLEAAKLPQPEISRQLDWLLHAFRVVPVSGELLRAAQKSKVTDYEDAVVEQAAIHCQATAIVTRNVKDFKHSLVAIMTPEVYLSEKEF